MVKVRIFVRLAILFMIVYSFVGTVQMQMKDKQIQIRKPDAPTSFELAEVPDEVLEEIEVEAHEYP